MTLDALDWLIIVVYLAGTLGLGILFAGRAGGGLSDYFLAGRRLTWWLAGTSIVATTFAADTPLMVSGFVRTAGIYENWFWWSAGLGAMVSVVFYARLWRRSGLLTDLEFIERRYAGRAAASLRFFLAVYAGAVSNCIGMGVVMLAMAKLGAAAFGWPDTITVAGLDVSGKLVLLGTLMVVVLVYTITAGLWGVIATDAFEFALAMIGALTMMVMVYLEMGGPTQLVERVSAAPGTHPQIFAMVPDLSGAGGLAVFTFAVYLGVQWWASTSAASANTQRMLATKDERHATYAALWGAFAHYVLRPWPWIIVGLASIVYFPLTPGEDPEAAYPRMMMELLPTGLRGVMVVAFLAAFMSTIDTRLNWGASYLVNDLYRRFARPSAAEAHYVKVSRIMTLALLLGAGLAAWSMDSIIGAWMFLVKLGAGAGLVVLLRWFWWRINAWSEISALATSFVVANLLAFVPGVPDAFAVQLVIVVGVSTAAWLVVTFLTPATDMETLETFYRQVQPGGWWGPVARRCPEVVQERMTSGWFTWAACVVSLYTSLLGVGYVCLGSYVRGLAMLAIAALSGWYALRRLQAMAHSVPTTDPTTPGPVDGVPALTSDPRGARDADPQPEIRPTVW